MNAPHIIKQYTGKMFFTFSVLMFAAGCGENLKDMHVDQAKALEKTALKTYQQKNPTAEEKQASTKALETLRRAVTRKNVSAEYYLGRYMIDTADKNAASPLIRAAANQGDPEAEFLLSLMYRQGYGAIRQDSTKEAFWLTKSANSGYSKAEFLFAIASMNGTHGVEADAHATYVFMRKAAHAGIPAAQYLLFTMYEHGDHGAPADPEKSKYWAQKVEGEDSMYAAIVKKTLAQRALVRQEDATNSGPDTGRFSTDCDNMSCVRRYSNGAVIHFTACMNPADMEPMDSAPVVDGQGACSGTDAEGNFYGMGSFN